MQFSTSHNRFTIRAPFQFGLLGQLRQFSGGTVIGRIAGRNGRLYVGLATSTSTAEPLPFTSKWSISFSTDDFEVTAMGDANKVYVSGLPDAQGSFSGFYDTATAQTYTAATDGQARRMYLYPDNTTGVGTYFFGTAIFDFGLDADVAGPVTAQGKWKANSNITKVG